MRESDSKASHADIDQTDLSNYDLPTALQAATQVASKLLTTAIYDEDENVEWLGIDLGADGEKFSFGPVGISLYGGSSGIAILFRDYIILVLILRWFRICLVVRN